MSKYYFIDAFCGAGGLSLGLTRAGLSPLYAFDSDPLCCKTIKQNHKFNKFKVECISIDEILKLNICAKLHISKGELFLLAGGPPCQGFSIQRGRSDNDDRNVLVLKYVELLGQLFPKFLLLENVPGLLGKKGRLILEKAIKKIKQYGYELYYAVLDAQEYGVPQRRKRVFMVAIRKDLGIDSFKFPTPSKRKKVTVRDVIGKLPAPPLDYSEHPKLLNHRRDRLSSLNLARISYLKERQGREFLPDKLIAKCHRVPAKMIGGHTNVYGRMGWDDVAPTITARFDSFTRGLFGHPEDNRTISLREGALLQTFPKDYVFFGNKVEVARQIGNAIPPKMGEVWGKHFLRLFGSTCEKNNFPIRGRLINRNRL